MRGQFVAGSAQEYQHSRNAQKFIQLKSELSPWATVWLGPQCGAILGV